MDISSLRERSASQMSVSELNNFIKNMFDSNRLLTSVTVRGEISNFTNHRSGHFYFSLKDSESQIKCVMFRSSAARLKFMPESGMKVIAHGSVSVYPRDGSYQFYVNSLQPDGVGALYMAYEQLKAKLETEGLFAPESKKDIPQFPQAVGVITSPTGAAVRDIINVTGRRYPLAKIYLYPSLVQGDGAAANLIRALEYFDKSSLVDTVIIGRGGGSIEDLWAFNDEGLARKIYDMSVPVISAVGHETDFTICDFVADMRAPTPSAAAELAVPDTRELFISLSDTLDRITAGLLHISVRKREKLESLSEKFARICATFTETKRKLCDDALDELVRTLILFVKDKNTELAIIAEKLNAMSPLAVLSRGYTIAEEGGRAIGSVSSLKPNDELKLRFSDGSAIAVLKEISEDKHAK